MVRRHRGASNAAGGWGIEMILLDTHVLISMSSGPKKLSQPAHEAIRGARELDRENPGVAVAAITLWELAGLAHSGRLLVARSVDSYVRETVSRVSVRPLTAEIAALRCKCQGIFRRIQRTG